MAYEKNEVEKLHKHIQNIITLTNYGSYLRNAFSANDKITRFNTHD